jgi:hypothetical protein
MHGAMEAIAKKFARSLVLEIGENPLHSSGLLNVS